MLDIEMIERESDVKYKTSISMYRFGKLKRSASMGFVIDTDRLFQFIVIKIANENENMLNVVPESQFPQVAAFIVSRVRDEILADQEEIDADGGYDLSDAERLKNLSLISFSLNPRAMTLNVETENDSEAFNLSFSS